MNEYLQGFVGALALLPSIVFSVLSMIGGRPNGRIFKRVLAPVSFCLMTIGVSLIAHHFNWWYFLSIPAYMLSTAIGYGGLQWDVKLKRRTIWSTIRILSSLTFVLFTGTWIIFGLQTIVCLLVTLILGIANPLVAPAEEGLINFMSVIFIPFCVL